MFLLAQLASSANSGAVNDSCLQQAGLSPNDVILDRLSKNREEKNEQHLGTSFVLVT